jgi:hypothetical protein
MGDLRDRGRLITRQSLSELLRLRMTIIDDHVKRMKDNGEIRMAVPGVYELLDEAPPDRAISATFLPNGRVKVEVGDDLLDLSMRECQALGMATAGVFLQFTRLE